MLSARIIIEDADFSFILPEHTCQRFTLTEIQSATYNFKETLVIGRGGFGMVYKCRSKIGSIKEVAVKRLNCMSNQGANEFEAEVKLLSKLRHGNLVSVIGYCNEGKEMVLVYEFMPNGTLEDHLRKADSDLSWLQRLKICVGAARGLDYLHTGTSTQHGVIHRDVKTSNILLDANFAAKISDFGLAKVSPIDQNRTYVSTCVKGTFGYMDPCYFYTGKLTRKSDVYAFGVVLLEVLTGRQAVDSTLDEEQWSLAAWAQDQIKEGKLSKMIDTRLMGKISRKCLKDFASIASHCLHNNPKQRPTMAEVVIKLESILSQEKDNINSVVDEGGFIYKPDLKLEEFNHPNLIKLCGYCMRWNQFYCLYEFIPGTTLDKYLFEKPGRRSVSWVALLKIALGAAQGLAFLHIRKHPAYTQFQTNHILVDKDLNARLSDYEPENMFAIPESLSYDADKIDGPGPGVKSEIYAFGVVLLEILTLTKMKAYDMRRPPGKESLVNWVTPILTDELQFGKIMDPQLKHNDYPPKGAFKLAQLVSKCLHPNVNKCPSMEEIVQVLCQCYEEEIKSVFG